MNKIYQGLIVVLLGGTVLIGGGLYAFNTYLGKLQFSYDSKLMVLEQQISALSKDVSTVTGQSASTAVSLDEVMRRQQAQSASPEEQLTTAVSNATPSVVSVVISKDVPQLEVTYVNPFGDDPYYKNFNIRVPVYQQKGTVKEKVGAASGFIVTSTGYIITNKHVVDDQSASYTVLLSSGAQKAATVAYRDPNQDIAILKIDGTGYSALPLGDSASIKLGESVAAIGNALGEYNNSVSVGIVSGLNRTIQASDTNGTVESLSGIIQTDAAINPGNSGGPLLDLSGKAIGINVATVVGSNNISFAIPINSVKAIVSKVIPH